MKNKRSKQTDTNYAGTETGSVTYTVTFFPEDYEEDFKIVELLEQKKKRRLANGWLRDAAIAQVYGNNSKPIQNTPTQPRQSAMANPEPFNSGSNNDGDDAAGRAAAGMGLKLGGKKRG